MIGCLNCFCSLKILNIQICICKDSLYRLQINPLLNKLGTKWNNMIKLPCKKSWICLCQNIFKSLVYSSPWELFCNCSNWYVHTWTDPFCFSLWVIISVACRLLFRQIMSSSAKPALNLVDLAQVLNSSYFITLFFFFSGLGSKSEFNVLFPKITKVSTDVFLWNSLHSLN